MASLVAQMLKNWPAIQKKQKRELGLREEVTAQPYPPSGSAVRSTGEKPGDGSRLRASGLSWAGSPPSQLVQALSATSLTIPLPPGATLHWKDLL